MPIDRPTRRAVLGALAASALAAPALAQSEQVVVIPREFLPTDVALSADATPGVIHVDIANTWLYYVTAPRIARRYKIAVGAAGRNFRGEAVIRRRAEWPSWTPTANMIRQEPHIYAQSAGGLPGGHPRNPLGARALYLYQGGRDTLYRIHGTPQPWTIGRSFSSGCVRMINEHMIDLYDRVPIGTRVVVA
ncbi:L,D-transpeptidase [Wenxinia saemankumensis]|uniref:L,D-transpeptidase catalytic domain n=1 Tax=Wenxinia saemankumensis TaxID=1447782 RepID=A0A1M6C4S6_9RHOB|nr:L,D-transpeptidase [Wenxinia saemankumensis]SHI55738.1 L,D-transpeptidase catalytic domain [Wenxinia saemankumensis]